MVEQVISNTFENDLKDQYKWFNNLFASSIKATSDDFFQYGFEFKLMAMSLNINAMFQDDSYFVTKINIDEAREVFIRCSEKAIGLILDKVLEPVENSKQAFNLNFMSELEAKIITNFNDMFYSTFASNFIRPKGSLKFRTFDILHLTFLMRAENDEKSENVGKIILSMPYQFLNPEIYQNEEETFTDYAFLNKQVEVDIKIGTTLFTLKDLKMLEPEDIVVFDNSNIQTMRVICGEYEREFNVEPDSSLIVPFDESMGGDTNMNNTGIANLWDSIQVEMGAEFAKIKIPLGQLKRINEGGIIDISSIYNNKISLKIEETLIAEGELVIVNDRYGVKVNKIFPPSEVMPNNTPNMIGEYSGMQPDIPEGISQEMYEQMTPEQIAQMQEIQQQGYPEQQQIEEYNPNAPQSNEEFDYSDFEIDDEDI